MKKPLLSARHIYFLHTVLFDFGLSWGATTCIPGLQKLGITVAQIGMMESLFWIFMLVSEIPAGLYADRVSRVRTLGISSVLLCIGGVLYATATNFHSVLAGELTLGVGMSIGGNALRSWIIGAVQQEDDGNANELRLTKLFGTTQVLRSMLALGAGALGGLVKNPTQMTIWLPFVIGNVLNLLLITTVMQRYPEAKQQHLSQKETLCKGFNEFKQNRSLIWIAASATIMGMLIPYFNYWTLYFRASVGEERMSAVWICAFIPVTLGGWIIRRFGHGKMTEYGAILATLALPALGVAVLAQTTHIPVQISVLVLLQLGRGMFQPLMDTFIAKRVKDEVRTTTLSIISSLGKGAYIAFPALVYSLSKGMPDGIPLIRTIWCGASACMIVSLCALWLFRPRDKQ